MRLFVSVVVGLRAGDGPFREWLLAILDERRRSATVTTTSPARVLVLFGTEFRRLQQEHPEIAARLEAVATAGPVNARRYGLFGR